MEGDGGAVTRWKTVKRWRTPEAPRYCPRCNGDVLVRKLPCHGPMPVTWECVGGCGVSGTLHPIDPDETDDGEELCCSL